MLKNSSWIKQKSLEGMITPFQEKNTLKDKISYGLGAYGYDITLAENIKVFKNSYNPIDPKRFDESILKDLDIYTDSNTLDRYVLLPAHSFALAHSIEFVNIPRGIKALLHCKSTYARCGLHINNTTIQAGFKGQIVIELSNNTPIEIMVYIGEGIGELTFLESDEITDRMYQGKYQNQEGLQCPKI